MDNYLTIVGSNVKGPVNTPIEIKNQEELFAIFGKPYSLEEEKKKTKTQQIMDFLCPEEEVIWGVPNKNGRSYPINNNMYMDDLTESVMKSNSSMIGDRALEYYKEWLAKRNTSTVNIPADPIAYALQPLMNKCNELLKKYE
jgi:hypothetical protein